MKPKMLFIALSLFMSQANAADGNAYGLIVSVFQFFQIIVLPSLIIICVVAAILFTIIAADSHLPLLFVLIAIGQFCIKKLFDIIVPIIAAKAEAPLQVFDTDYVGFWYYLFNLLAAVATVFFVASHYDLGKK